MNNKERFQAKNTDLAKTISTFVAGIESYEELMVMQIAKAGYYNLLRLDKQKVKRWLKQCCEEIKKS